MRRSKRQVGEDGGRAEEPRGSAVLFALFACMVAVICIQVLTAAVVYGNRAMDEEVGGREVLAHTDSCLEWLRATASETWDSVDWTDLGVGECGVEGRLTDTAEPSEWVLVAEVLQHRTSGVKELTRSLVERARDGLDLPLAALVAAKVCVVEERSTPWLVNEEQIFEGDSESGGSVEPLSVSTARAYVGAVESQEEVGDDCQIESLDWPWELGDGWREFLASNETVGRQVCVVQGENGEWVRMPESVLACDQDHPVLVIALGACTLDLRGLGEVWGVFVSDKGSISLEATVVHGGVFASGCVDFGGCGQVVYCEGVCRWAKDRSLKRVRLVPGSRQEVTE